MTSQHEKMSLFERSDRARTALGKENSPRHNQRLLGAPCATRRSSRACWNIALRRPILSRRGIVCTARERVWTALASGILGIPPRGPVRSCHASRIKGVYSTLKPIHSSIFDDWRCINIKWGPFVWYDRVQCHGSGDGGREPSARPATSSSRIPLRRPDENAKEASKGQSW
jgi:hypothetical protein